MDLGLEGKVVLVTAASTGLGRAAAAEFSRQGAQVVICARSERINLTAQEIQRETGGTVRPFRADVTRKGDVETMVRRLLHDLGRIDILILNAGGPPPGGFLDLTPEDWQAAFQLTVMSAVFLCYAVVPAMVEAGSGSIVATQSWTVKQPLENLVLSNSLRMAVIGLTKSLANELGPKGIRVNSINPAWTYTERVESLVRDRAERNRTTVEEETARLVRGIPLGRMATLEEYGRTIVWLASPAASFIHGHALFFDGGLTKATL
jgi:3-oxoacyl-[acyl-carrier protein] reductase